MSEVWWFIGGWAWGWVALFLCKPIQRAFGAALERMDR